MVNWLRTIENALNKTPCESFGFPMLTYQWEFWHCTCSAWSASWNNLRVASLYKRVKMTFILKKMLEIPNFNETWALQHVRYFMCIEYFCFSVSFSGNVTDQVEEERIVSHNPLPHGVSPFVTYGGFCLFLFWMFSQSKCFSEEPRYLIFFN